MKHLFLYILLLLAFLSACSPDLLEGADLPDTKTGEPEGNGISVEIDTTTTEYSFTIKI